MTKNDLGGDDAHGGRSDLGPAARSTAPHVVRYVSAIGRNPGEELGRSHLYAELSDGDYLPMCRWGWNRSNGAALSIFRGHMGARGLCAICDRRRERGLPPVDAKPGSHKTRWI